MNNPYIGHGFQLYGIEEHRLVGGKGDGMRLLIVNNGEGLELTVSALKFPAPGESKTYEVTVRMLDKQ